MDEKHGYLWRAENDRRNKVPYEIRYVPGEFNSREGDWDSNRGRYDYAGYGFIRPSPHGWINGGQSKT